MTSPDPSAPVGESPSTNLLAGWTATRSTWRAADALVDPAGPDPETRLPHVPQGATIAFTPLELRNRLLVDPGDLLLRDPGGLLRVRVVHDHQRVDLIGVKLPETTAMLLPKRLLASVTELPFGYPPGVFVCAARVEDGIDGAPHVRLWLSRPLWWFGPVPFACDNQDEG